MEDRGQDNDYDTYNGSDGGEGSKAAGRWTSEEHRLFLHGLQLHQKQWKLIADLVKTRTVVQIRTHAQKYFQKLDKMKRSDTGDMGMPPAACRADSISSGDSVGGSSSDGGASDAHSDALKISFPVVLMTKEKDALASPGGLNPASSQHSGVAVGASPRKRGRAQSDTHIVASGAGSKRAKKASPRGVKDARSFSTDFDDMEWGQGISWVHAADEAGAWPGSHIDWAREEMLLTHTSHSHSHSQHSRSPSVSPLLFEGVDIEGGSGSGSGGGSGVAVPSAAAHHVYRSVLDEFKLLVSLPSAPAGSHPNGSMAPPAAPAGASTCTSSSSSANSTSTSTSASHPLLTLLPSLKALLRGQQASSSSSSSSGSASAGVAAGSGSVSNLSAMACLTPLSSAHYPLPSVAKPQDSDRSGGSSSTTPPAQAAAGSAELQMHQLQMHMMMGDDLLLIGPEGAEADSCLLLTHFD